MITCGLSALARLAGEVVRLGGSHVGSRGDDIIPLIGVMQAPAKGGWMGVRTRSGAHAELGADWVRSHI